MLEQQASDVERSELVDARDHDHRAVAHDGQRARVGRHVERRAAEQVPFIDIGAGPDQIGREIVVQVLEREHKRRHALGVDHVGIGAGFHERPRAVDAAFARGVVQRREAALVHVLGPGLVDDLARPLADGAVRVERGAIRREEAHHVGVAARRGPHQGRLAAEVFDGVDVGTRIDEQLRGLDTARARDGHQRRLALGVAEVRVGAGCEQGLEDGDITGDGGLGDRRSAKRIYEADVGTGLHERRDEIGIAVVRRVHDGRRAVGAAHICVGAGGKRGMRCRGVVGLGGGEQGFAVSAGSRRRCDERSRQQGRERWSAGRSKRSRPPDHLPLRPRRTARRCRRSTRRGCRCDRTA